MEGGQELYDNLLKAMPQVAKFNELSGQNGKTMCHGDARTENCLWPNQRKDPLVLIDWQFVSYSSPLQDVCYFIGVCLNPDEQDKYADALIKHYYDTLTTSPGGPTTTEYPYDLFLLDYKRCMWVSMWVSVMGISNLECIAKMAEKHKDTPEGEAYTTLKENMTPLLISFMVRHLNEAKRCDAASIL
jgi:thiamine kinase-like enzyme